MTLRIKPILCRKGTMDNYAYIITDTQSDVSAIVDAAEAAPIVAYCEENNITPKYILTTHHHFDHVEGNAELKNKYGLQIVAPKAEQGLIDGVDICVSDSDIFNIGSCVCEVIAAPGHTKGHVLWYFKDNKTLFTGDVLFNLCIGGLFEGLPEEMFNTLKKIKGLPDDVEFYPGHEYTEHGLRHLMKDNTSETVEYLDIAIFRLQNQMPVSPIKLGLEKKCNPYLKIANLTDFSRLF